MRRGGIQEQFWLHATRKAGVGRGNASTSTQKSQLEEEEDFDVLPPPPDTKEQPPPHELTTNTASYVPLCSTNAQKQPALAVLQEKSPKRFRTQPGGDSEASDFIPPENPCFLNSADIGRTWYYTRRNDRRHRKRPSIPFKVVTYNVLADSLLKSHPALYEDCSAWCLEWEYRKKNLLKEILHYNADILCLQEIEEQHYENWFKPELQKAGYQGAYKKRTGNKVDGCATFYKESRFRIVTHRFLDYKRENVPVLDRDNVALLTLLYPRYQNGGTCHSTALCVVNTHLLFNKNRGDIKLLQLACLFAEIDKLKKEYLSSKGRHKPQNSIKKIPVVLSGDFNTTPFCPLYNFIIKGYLNYKGMNKKALSGQNPPHHLMHRDRDVIHGNIVPLELGLSHLSMWDEEPPQGQAGGAASSSSTSVFAQDDFGTVNSGWQEYSFNSDVQQRVPATTFSVVPRQRGTRNIPSQYQHSTYQRVPSTTFSVVPQQRGTRNIPSQYQQSRNSFNSDVQQRVPSTTFSVVPQQRGTTNIPSQYQQSTYRGHPYELTTARQLVNNNAALLLRYQQNTSSGNQETPSNPQQSVDELSRYHVPPEPRNPRRNPTCTILKHDLDFYSVYRHSLRDGIKEVTTYHEKEPSCTVDYIFVAAGRESACSSCRQKHAVLELTGRLQLLGEDQIMMLGGLPNQKLSSDHLALVAGFVLHV